MLNIKENIESIKKLTGYNFTIPQAVFINSRLKDFNGIDLIDYFKDEDHLHYDPTQLKDLKEAAEVLYKHIKLGNLIVTNSDYDADGVTSGAIMDYALNKYFNHNNIFKLQNERELGNGFNESSLKKLIEKHLKNQVGLLLTGDHGSADEYRYKQVPKEIDIVVTDHHKVPTNNFPNTPKAFVNPQREDSTFSKKISGATVVCLLIIEVYKLKCIDENIEFRQNDVMDVIAYAGITVLTDQMDIKCKLNRTLVKLALNHLSNHPNKNYLKLFSMVKIPLPVTENVVNFNIGPLLNGAGRMGKAYIAREFLSTDNDGSLYLSIEDMVSLNDKRKALQNSIMNDVYKQVTTYKQHYKHTLVLRNDDAHGIGGIISGTLGESELRPTFVFSSSPIGLTGSGRAILPGIKLPDMFDEIREKHPGVIIRGGGHDAAAGCTIVGDRLTDFSAAFEDYVARHATKEFKVPYDIDIHISNLTRELTEDINKLGPFGNGYLPPVYRVTAKYIKHSDVGPVKNHALINIEGFKDRLFFMGGKSKMKGINVGDEIYLYVTSLIEEDKQRLMVKYIEKKI